jgi:hypothetical protein
MTGPVQIKGQYHEAESVLPTSMLLTVLKQVITLVLTPLAIRRFIAQVSGNAELLNALGGHLPRQDPVDIAELGECIISGNKSSLRLII